jgi:uncharacterized protein (DUF1697 family)
MKDLRAVAESLGYRDVATYIQSGNVVFESEPGDVEAMAEGLETAIRERLGVSCAVVVIDRRQLARVIADNPFPDEPEPRHLHAVFRRHELGADHLAAIDTARKKATERGSRDEVAIKGNTLYLRTPDGLGRSELAAQLDRGPGTAGTARNWATVQQLMALVQE